MRKESTKYIKSIFLAVLTAMLLVSCGGGGGGGGMVSFSNNSELHNGGDAGGWHGSGGGINNGSNSNSEVELIITGSTPLSVERYEYNGVTYNSAQELIDVLSTSTLPDSFDVNFYVEGESEPRKARVSANNTAGNGQDIFIEHQYMATFALPDADGLPGAPITIPFYKRDGISLADIANAIGNETVGSGADEVLFELQKLKIGTTEYDKNGSLAVNESGDVTLDGNSIKGVYEKWGISSSGVVQFSSSINDGDAVVINTTEPIMRIDNPSDKLISLDLQNMNTNNTTFIRNFINSPENVTELVLPNCINVIIADALSNATNLTRVVIPDNVETIGENAFKGLENLQSVTLPTNANFTEIPESIFEGCTSLESITIPDSVTRIGDYAFDGCEQLSSVTLSNNLLIIGNASFNDCTSLTSITFPDTLTNIQDEAFRNCAKLGSISIPASVTEIGNGAFRECFTDLSRADGVTVNFYANPPIFGPGAFEDCTYLKNICGRASSFVFDASNNSFSGCTNLEYLNLSSCGSITLYASMFADTTKNVNIDLAQNNISITLVDDVAFTGTQPLFVIGNPIRFQNLSFTSLAPSVLTWGGKDVYVLVNGGNDPVVGYNVFNASGGNGFMWVAGTMTSWPDAVIAATP